MLCNVIKNGKRMKGDERRKKRNETAYDISHSSLVGKITAVADEKGNG
jgi:hypothetical protein